MKKNLLLFLTCIVLFATSCVKDNSNTTPNQTIFLNVKSTDWKTTDGGKTYSASYSMPGITSFVNDYYGVLVYAAFTNGVYEELPEVYNGVAYSFSHSVGNLTIDIQASDGKTVITQPGAFTLKTVLVTSN
jgi:hypothetical protein